MQRIRFVFQKTGDLRFLSHLEVMKALGRALRRARVPMAYSQGYNPQPKLSCALALPVGVEGLQELADIELTMAMAPEELVARANRHLAKELHLLRAWEVPLTAPSLTPSVREAVYQVSLPLNPHSAMPSPQLAGGFFNGSDRELRARLSSPAVCDEWLSRPSIPVSVQRKEKLVEVDVRPQIRELLALQEEGGALRWSLRLKTAQGGSVRPQVIMACLLKDALNGQVDGWETKLRVARIALILDGQMGPGCHCEPKAKQSDTECRREAQPPRRARGRLRNLRDSSRSLH